MTTSGGHCALPVCFSIHQSQTKVLLYLQRQGPDVVDVPDELAYVHYVVGGEVGDVTNVDVPLVRRGNGGFFLRLGAGPFRSRIFAPT